MRRMIAESWWTEKGEAQSSNVRRVPQPSVYTLRGLPFPPPLRLRPAFVPFLRTNLISTLLPNACASFSFLVSDF